MKKLLPILLLAAVACSSPKKEGFKIEVAISGETPDMAYLQLYENGEMNTLDSAQIKNGTFVFEGKTDYPDRYYIQLGDQRDRIALLLENSNISITAQVDSLNKAVISGSATQDAYNAYADLKKSFDKQLSELYQEYKAAADNAVKSKIEARYDSVDALKYDFIKQYVKSHGNSVLAPFIVRNEIIYYLDLAELEELADSISVNLKDYKYTKQLYDKIEKLRSLQPGKMAPEFTQNDVDGTPVSLSDYRGKYLMIDFWASWCSPCRKANPKVVALYKKYSQKDFDILGVSMDSKKENWLKAIHDDGLLWKQVSTLEGWNNPVGKLYSVMSIPHAILIDPDGKIIKRGLHVDEVEAILQQRLKQTTL